MFDSYIHQHFAYHALALLHSHISEYCMLTLENNSQGNDSSDGEELDGAPDDDEYDTEDSFIDDAELVGVDVFISFYAGRVFFLTAETSYLCFLAYS